MPQGSPPHVRGKAKEEPYRPCHPGITPACAGKRRGSCRRMHRIWDHPRMCGEKASEYTCPLISLGSPPHVRGKVGAAGLNNLIDGITPACAGKSLSGHTSKSGMKDHPRMCGEKLGVVKLIPQLPGSPPRMRGKAGEYGSQTHRPQDHPRVCGEKPARSRARRRNWGSPPRMRGKDSTKDPCWNRWGITPAYAGKRRICVQRWFTGGDHPRVCGEK